MGRLELDFGGIGCEFGGSAHLLPLLLNGGTTFLIFWSSGIDDFFFISAIQCRKMSNGIKDSIEHLPL